VGNDDTAKKFDEGKIRYDLIPIEAFEDLARVGTMGAAKYGDNNWRQGDGVSRDRLYAAAMRHIASWRKGELIDPESGLPHTAHAMWNLMAIAYFDRLEQLKRIGQ
jgi:hypothetical protein